MTNSPNKSELTKEDRQAAILEKVAKENIATQKELESFFNVRQSTISKDLKALGIVKDPKDKFFKLGEDTQRQIESKKLRSTLSTANCKFITGNEDIRYDIFFMHSDPLHADVVSSTLEQFFYDYGVRVLAGITGTIVLFIPTSNKKVVLKELMDFFY